jgi:tetratricopeptide (TPR) repeat protein
MRFVAVLIFPGRGIALAAETKIEKHAWNLLTVDFPWDPPEDFGVKVRREGGSATGPARLQVFEVAVAAIFARLRPDYEWYVTPNLPDGGSDFIGRQEFLIDDVLDIAAAITIGGQCKKRSRVGDVVQEVAGSLVNMVTTLNPTLFIVALSARLTEERITEARARVERAYQRHCHILDRAQIEGLLSKHRTVVDEILREALSDEEIAVVHEHLRATQQTEPHQTIVVSAPKRVLAGVPFDVKIDLRSFSLSVPGTRLWWRAGPEIERQDARINVVGPVDADAPAGMELALGSATDDPIEAQLSLELLTHSVGDVDLGEIAIGLQGDDESAASWTPLGTVRVIENLRPRFYEQPFRGALSRLEHEYERALANGVASIGVVGMGGSGKSRLSEEFALRQRRRGSTVVVAKQAKTLDDPHRIIADFLLGLVEVPSLDDPADSVIRAVARYDADLATRAESAVRTVFGLREGGTSATTEQHLLSALLLLVAMRGRRAPLIVHLQELHWCSNDVLLLFERLVWQLGRVLPRSRTLEQGPDSGILFIFEGRVRERQRIEGGWDSEPFEALLQKLDCPKIACSFDPDQGLEFIRRLFEDRYSAHRRVNLDMLEMQRDLVGRIHRIAGGNPFHSLEQLQFLKERRIVGQNPITGFLYLIQPALSDTQLPDSVFEAIRMRWIYMKSRTPEVALLIWAAALLDDRVPTPLFRRLLAELAPHVALSDVDATEMLWSGEGREDEVAFRHENYFESIRRFEVAMEDRKRVVHIYCSWFAEPDQSTRPVDRYKWALALLQLPVPDEAQAEKLMRSALREAQRQGDARLARRVSAASLNLVWKRDGHSPIRISTFLSRAEDELALTTELLGGGDRSQADRRLNRLSDRLDKRLSSGRFKSPQTVAELHRLRLTADARRSQILFNDRKPVEAAELAADAVREIRGLRSAGGFDGEAWEELEMEALHSQAVALAIAGEIEPSLATSAKAIELAARSSSVLARHVVSTYANILMSRDPEESATILRRCLDELDGRANATEARVSAQINLGMALVLRAHRLDQDEMPLRAALLAEATKILELVFSHAFQLGRYPDAGAASLMLGVSSAMRGDRDEVSWFAQAVAAAAKGRQMETLWRAHINLATALHRSGDAAEGDVRDHAAAALDILEETLSVYPEPDSSARFELVRTSLAQAIRFLQAAGDGAGRAVVDRYPALRTSFVDADLKVLRNEEHDGWRHEWWLRINGEPYSLY